MATKKLIIEIDEKYIPEIQRKLAPMCSKFEVKEAGEFDFDFRDLDDISSDIGLADPKDMVLIPGTSSMDAGVVDEEAYEVPLAPASDNGLSVAMPADMLRTVITERDFNDGLTNFSELGSRTMMGYQTATIITLVLLCLNRWVNLTELRFFIGADMVTIKAGLGKLKNEKWLNDRTMNRRDGVEGMGVPTRVDHWAIKPELHAKLRARWAGAANIRAILQQFPINIMPNSSSSPEDYSRQEMLVLNIRQELKLNGTKDK